MYRIVKRFFDFVCALIGIIVTSLLWIIAIAGILVSDWGPVFYTARRIGKGVMIGMETMIMPGVTIREGAIVGAGSLVTKDLLAWTIATGRPAKVIKKLPKREQ